MKICIDGIIRDMTEKEIANHNAEILEAEKEKEDMPDDLTADEALAIMLGEEQ